MSELQAVRLDLLRQKQNRKVLAVLIGLTLIFIVLGIAYELSRPLSSSLQVGFAIFSCSVIVVTIPHYRMKLAFPILGFMAAGFCGAAAITSLI